MAAVAVSSAVNRVGPVLPTGSGADSTVFCQLLVAVLDGAGTEVSMAAHPLGASLAGAWPPTTLHEAEGGSAETTRQRWDWESSVVTGA
jgi:hypothetical protein